MFTVSRGKLKLYLYLLEEGRTAKTRTLRENKKKQKKKQPRPHPIKSNQIKKTAEVTFVKRYTLPQTSVCHRSLFALFAMASVTGVQPLHTTITPLKNTPQQK